ncbi:hypothetical protein EDF35_1909 [Rathayibacter sp. PhB151]|nr:hypothetical protein [Rathayibacter sp. PhB151]TDX78695.1 hypothetical protein EDF35_1909 [Rathayibacter sp. PhB151]
MDPAAVLVHVFIAACYLVLGVAILVASVVTYIAVESVIAAITHRRNR